MKHFLTAFFFLLIVSVRSQENLNFFYGDTIFEYSHMKFEFKETMAYKTKFKSNVYITNFTDSFKIISPYDVKISKGDYAVTLSNRGEFVVPPKSTRRFRFNTDGSGFKYDKIKTVF